MQLPDLLNTVNIRTLSYSDHSSDQYFLVVELACVSGNAHGDVLEVTTGLSSDKNG